MQPIQTLTHKLQAIEKRRPTWQVTKPNCKPQSEIPITLHRVLALRDLELDVQTWTIAMIRDNGIIGHDMEVIEGILQGHAADEDKHDEQLGYLATYWGLTVNTEVEDAAYELIRLWRFDQSHPLAKKLCLEAMVLFQAMALMQLTAPNDLFTQSVREWILFDESAHVASARVLVRFAKVGIPADLVNLGRRTVMWLTQDLPDHQQQRFLKIATDILTTGTSPYAAAQSTVANKDPFCQRVNGNIPYTTRADY